VEREGRRGRGGGERWPAVQAVLLAVGSAAHPAAIPVWDTAAAIGAPKPSCASTHDHPAACLRWLGVNSMLACDWPQLNVRNKQAPAHLLCPETSTPCPSAAQQLHLTHHAPGTAVLE
jgi:hypothetical protein